MSRAISLILWKETPLLEGGPTLDGLVAIAQGLAPTVQNCVNAAVRILVTVFNKSSSPSPDAEPNISNL